MSLKVKQLLKSMTGVLIELCLTTTSYGSTDETMGWVYVKFNLKEMRNGESINGSDYAETLEKIKKLGVGEKEVKEIENKIEKLAQLEKALFKKNSIHSEKKVLHILSSNSITYDENI
jgi:5-deoxy-D-glucuronate isomerase